MGILFVRHPYLGFSDGIVTDAEAVATGHLQYGNPATQFVGLPYTPINTFLLAGLLKLYWWEGWEQVVSMLAIAAAIVSLVRMLWVTTFRLEGRLATASIVVALSLGGLLSLGGAYGRSVDQLAWCLVVVAATVTFRGLLSPNGLTRRQMLVIGLLLTSSVFSKQTTIVPCLLVSGLPLAVLIAVEPRRSRTWRKWLRSATVLLTFAGVSALFGSVLQVASHGYAFDLLTDGQLRYVRIISLRQQTNASLRALTVPLAALVVLVLCLGWSLIANRDRHQRLHTVVSVAAVVVAVSSIPTAIVAEAKLGGGSNQLVGPLWTLTLGCAVLLLLLRPAARQLAAAAIAFSVLLAGINPLSHVMAEHTLAPPKLYQEASWPSIDPYLIAAVKKGETVYDVDYPSLSTSPRVPSYPASDIFDLGAAGYTPRWLIQNLLEGRYALVRPFDEFPYLYSTFTEYTSNFGQYDGSVPWKIDLLIRMGYSPVRDPVSGIFYYQPTVRLKQLSWFAGCFGPYQAQGAGVDVRLRGAGGLVCIDQGDLHLSQAPGPTTDLVMTLAEGTGEATLRFATTPHTLQITRLDGHDQPSSSISDIARSVSAVAKCLAHDGTATTLTLLAVHGLGATRCHIGRVGPVLDVPVVEDQSTAHVLIQLAAVDSPTLVATSTSGRPVPFTLLNPTPADIKHF